MLMDASAPGLLTQFDSRPSEIAPSQTPSALQEDTWEFTFAPMVAEGEAAGDGYRIPLGRSFEGEVARFMPRDGYELVSDYAATIDWGDGLESRGLIRPA